VRNVSRAQVRAARRRLILALTVLACSCAFGAQAARAAGAPQAGPAWVDGIKSDSAKLHGEASPNGLATSARFEYLTAASYEANLEAGKDPFSGAATAPAKGSIPLGAGSATVVVTPQEIKGLLASNTTYRYRLVASNEAGTGVSQPARAFTTDQLAPVFTLPDDRGWEMVSPIDKNGGQIQPAGGNFGGGVLQAALGGGAITYTSASSFADGVGAPGASQYLALRTGSGWATDNITLATEAGAYGDHPDGVPYRLFSPDLGTALMLDGRLCQPGPCPRSYSLRQSATEAISPLGLEEPDLAFAGASPGLDQIVFSTCAALTADATEVPMGSGCDPAAPNLYRWSGGALALVNLLPGDAEGTPGARLAAQAGAISTGGSRVYFTAMEDGALYLREAAGQTKLLPESPGGGASFQVASADGSVAYFTRGGVLYRYDALAQASEVIASGVTGVLGASSDGAYLYYAAAGGLFLWRSGETSPISPQVDPGNSPPATGRARVSLDGRHLAFVSSAELTDYDNNGVDEVYLYTAPGPGAGSVVCASCNPSGERPIGPATLAGATRNGSTSAAPYLYKPRALSAGSDRLFFESFDALAPQDTNNDRDVYQWEAQGSGDCAAPGGCTRLISSGRAEEGASFVDASADGADAFFLTDGKLVNRDPGSVDLYDARVGGGFPEPGPPFECEGDDCQPLPPEPEDPSPGTLQPPGVGDTPPEGKKCPKGKVKRKGRCVKRPHRHHHHAKRGAKR
jgi:hypothetical protein